MVSVDQNGAIYTAFLKEKNYDRKSMDCILETVEKMRSNHSSDDHPGMLLGKIQSGKTRTYLGSIALAFDNDYDLAIVFTKGTNALTHQTVARLEDEFRDLITYDQVDVFDIMSIRNHGLNEFQLQKKVIIVCKKEDDNLGHLQKLLFEQNPALGKRRALLIDDEADFASVSFQKSKHEGVKARTYLHDCSIRYAKDFRQAAASYRLPRRHILYTCSQILRYIFRVKSSNRHGPHLQYWCLFTINTLVETTISETVRSRGQWRGICMKRLILWKWSGCVNRIAAVANLKRF